MPYPHKPAKHICQFNIIAHYEDFSRILVICGQGWGRKCNKTDVIERGKVKIAERKYRPETDEEYLARWAAIPHICCQ